MELYSHPANFIISVGYLILDPKQFTAMAILMLQEDGQLNVQDPIEINQELSVIVIEE